MAYYRPYQVTSKYDLADSGSKVTEVRSSLAELTACWEGLQGQVTDKQNRLEQTLHYQQLYQDAMSNVTGWLDDIELRLFGTQCESDAGQHLRDNEVGGIVSFPVCLLTLDEQFIYMRYFTLTFVAAWFLLYHAMGRDNTCVC